MEPAAEQPRAAQGPPPQAHEARLDRLEALRNGAKLGSSLVFTWGVAVAIRILLPRRLGPEAFGQLNFADAFALTAFVLAGLGVDIHVRKEFQRRPEVVSEVFGGLLALRVLLTGLLLAACALILHATGRHPVVWRLVFVFGLAQLVLAVNGTLSAILQARGTVNGLTLANMGSKVLWAAGVLAGMWLGHPLMAVPASLLLSEMAKAVVLYRQAHRHAGLRLRLDGAGTRAALLASLPFYANQIAYTAYGRIDVTVLSFVVDDGRELGWYGAASTLAGLSLLVSPLLGWVLLPLFARAADRGPAELADAVARSMELVLLVVVPIGLLLALGADVWVGLVFGAVYAPAAAALRLLATTFVFTYVAMVSGVCLNVTGRGWHLTAVSFAALLLNPILNVTLVRLAMAHAPVPGGPGAAAALAMLISEALVATTLTVLLRGLAFDRRGTGIALRLALGAVLVVAIDRLALGLGPARLAVDAAAFVGLAVLLGAVRWREMAAFVRAAATRPADPAARPALPIG